MQPALLIGLVFTSISIGSLIVVGSVAIIALGSSGVFTPSNSPVTTTTTTTTTTTITTTISSTTTTTTTTTMGARLLNDLSNYPSGSYSARLSSFNPASNNLALIPITSSALVGIGGVDNSSMIIETGRAQYLYFHLPNGTSNSSSSTVKRDTDRVKLARLAIGSNIITGVAIRFITNSSSSSSNDSVIVIPISDNNGTSNQPSVKILFYYLSDGSTIIRIEISVPTALCPSSNGQAIDACQSISYQAYTILNNNQITSSFLVNIQMACGDIGSLSTGLRSASCTICDGQQVTGFDTPVTRRYEMGSSTGTFQFYVETYVVKDRITVWNGGMLIFDTGCVSANGTFQVNYSSSSSSIRVDVEPNCDCPYIYGCETAWQFTVHCLNSTHSSQTIMNKNQNASDKLVKLFSSDKSTTERRLYANRNNLLKN